MLIDGQNVIGSSSIVADTTTGVSDAASPCDGFFPLAANHTMRLPETTTGLTVNVHSDDDVVLWIVFGNSNFCSADGETSITRGSWSAGDYEIFVGTPTQNATAEYTLEFEVN